MGRGCGVAFDRVAGQAVGYLLENQFVARLGVGVVDGEDFACAPRAVGVGRVEFIETRSGAGGFLGLDEALESLDLEAVFIGVPRPTAIIDVDNLLVVETDDALLICRKGSSQRVKEVVELLRRQGKDDLL